MKRPVPAVPVWWVRTAADAARWLRGESYLGDAARNGWTPAADDVARAVRSAELAVSDAERAGLLVDDRRAALATLRAALAARKVA